MSSRVGYAKGLLLHEWVESFDWKNVNPDFVILRIGDGHVVGNNDTISNHLDKKFTTHLQKAYERGIPVIPWYCVYPSVYGSTGWPLNDYNRWAPRENDPSMIIIDRMLSNKSYWHGMILGINIGEYNSRDNTYDAPAGWVSKTTERVLDLVSTAYSLYDRSNPTGPKRAFWAEFSDGVIDNFQWDDQHALEYFVKDRDISVWKHVSFPFTTYKGALDLNTLPYPDIDIPTYLMADRTGCFWRCRTVSWEGALSASGSPISLPVYLYYGSASSLKNRIGFTPPSGTTPVPPPDSGGGTTPAPDPISGDLNAVTRAVNANTAAVLQVLEELRLLRKHLGG